MAMTAEPWARPCWVLKATNRTARFPGECPEPTLGRGWVACCDDAMAPHPVTVVGVAIFFFSAAVFMGVVFSKGGRKRSKQLGVLMALVRGEHGVVSRVMTIASLGGVIVGMLALFAGVAANDLAREKRCQARCVEAGHRRGMIGPSMEQSMTRRNSAAFVACTCSGGESPALELRADSL